MTKRSSRLRAPADFGLAIQQARQARGMSQMELADVLGIPQSTVSMMESGKSTIYLRRLLAISKALDLNLTAAWEDADAPGS